MRILIAAVFFIGGFIFPVLFVVPALIAWVLIEEARNPPSNDDRGPNRCTVTAADKNWEEFYYASCESPAETEFLKAMIYAYKLMPDKGVLVGGGLSFGLQVVVNPYRLDFLANDWLVVEIDGAAYHSSPKAIASDKARDLNLNGRGYTVLRIPAKTVFATPLVAVDYVRAAIAAGDQRQKTAENGSTKIQEIFNPSFFSCVVKTMDELSDFISLEKAIAEANSDLVLNIAAEKIVIESAIERAEARISTEQFMAKSDEHRRRYLEAEARMQKSIDELRTKNGESAPKFNANFSIPPVKERNPHPEFKTEQAIQQTRQSLLDERELFFGGVRKRLNQDEQLKKLVRQCLQEFGCGDCWSRIS